jgi:hypothetical protein
VSTKVDAQLYKDVYDFWVQKAVEVGQKTGAIATFVPQHIPKGMVDIGYANGGNALGLSRETQQCKPPAPKTSLGDELTALRVDHNYGLGKARG